MNESHMFFKPHSSANPIFHHSIRTLFIFSATFCYIESITYIGDPAGQEVRPADWQTVQNIISDWWGEKKKRMKTNEDFGAGPVKFSWIGVWCYVVGRKQSKMLSFLYNLSSWSRWLDPIKLDIVT